MNTYLGVTERWDVFTDEAGDRGRAKLQMVMSEILLIYLILFFIDVYLIYSVLGIQKTDSVIPKCISICISVLFTFFSIIGY